MATSNNFSTSNIGVDYRIIVLETATSATNNTSTITVQVLARRNKAGTVVDYDGECQEWGVVHLLLRSGQRQHVIWHNHS